MAEGFRELLEGFGKSLVVRGFAAKSVQSYQGHLKPFFSFLEARGKDDLRRVLRDDLLAYQVEWTEARTEKEKPYQWGTLCLKTRAVKRFFEWLEETGRVFLNPAEGVREPRRETRLPKVVLTEDQVKRLLEAPDYSKPMGIRDKTILEVFYSTGIRLGELLALKIPDVDFEGGLLRVNQGKGAKDRVVPLGETAQKYLKGYLSQVRPMWERNWKGETAFFLNRHGDPVTATIVGKLVRDYAKKAGLEVTVTPHTLRHTFATHMVRHGADLTVVQRILGHTDLYVTQIYTHVAGVDVKKTHQETHPREVEVAHA